MKKIISAIMSILLILQMSPVSAYADALEALSLKSNKEQIVVKSNPDKQSHNTILKGPYEFKIQRDYDQKIRFELNASNETVGVEFTLEAEHGTADDLAFELTKNQLFIDKNNDHVEASFHAQDAQKRQYVFYLNMFKNGDFSERAKVLVTVVHPGLDIDIKEVSENPVTMSKTYEITNYGSTISDFSVHLDGDQALSLVEGVEHYRFVENEKFQITVLPDFSEKKELRGNIVMEGGVKNSKKLSVEFQDSDDSYLINAKDFIILKNLLSMGEENNHLITKDAYEKQLKENLAFQVAKQQINIAEKKVDFEIDFPNTENTKIKISSDISGNEDMKINVPEIQIQGENYILKTKVILSDYQVEQLFGKNSITANTSPFRSLKTPPELIYEVYTTREDIEKIKNIKGNPIDGAASLTSIFAAPIKIGGAVPVGFGISAAQAGYDREKYAESDASDYNKKLYDVAFFSGICFDIVLAASSAGTGTFIIALLGKAAIELIKTKMKSDLIEERKRFRHSQCINKKKLSAALFIPKRSYASKPVSVNLSSVITRINEKRIYKESFSYLFNGRPQGGNQKIVDGHNFVEITIDAVNEGVNEFVQLNTHTSPGSYTVNSDITIHIERELNGKPIKMRIPKELTLKEWVDHVNKDYRIEFPKPDLAVDATSLNIGYEEYQEKAFIGQEAKMLIRATNEGTETCIGKVQLIRMGDNKVIFEQDEVEFSRLSTKSFDTVYTPESQKEEFKLIVETKSNESNKNNNEFTFVKENYENPGEDPQIRLQPNDTERVVANITKDLLVEVKTKNETPIRRVDMRLNGDIIVLNTRKDQLATDSNAYYAKVKFKEGENTLQITAEDYFGNETSKEIRIEGFAETWALKSDFFKDNQFEMQIGEKLTLYNYRGSNIGFYMENNNHDRKYIGGDDIKRIELLSSEQGVVSVEDGLVAKTLGTSNISINYNDPDLGLVGMVIQVNVKESLPNVAIISGEIINDLIGYVNTFDHWKFERAVRIIDNEGGNRSWGLAGYRFEKTDDKKLVIRAEEPLKNKTLIIQGNKALFKNSLNENAIDLDDLAMYQIDFSTNRGEIERIHFVDTNLQNESFYFDNASGEPNNISLKITEGRYHIVVDVKSDNIVKSVSYPNQLLDQNKNFEIQIDDSAQTEKGTLLFSLPAGVSVTQLRFQSEEGMINMSQITGNTVELPIGQYRDAELQIRIGGSLYYLRNSKTFDIRAGESTEFSMDNHFDIIMQATNKQLFEGEYLSLRLSTQDQHGNTIGQVKVPIYWRNIETGDIIKTEKTIFGRTNIQLKSPSIAGTYELFIDSNYNEKTDSTLIPNPGPTPKPDVDEKPKDNSNNSINDIGSWGNNQSNVRPDNERKEGIPRGSEQMREKEKIEKEKFLAKLRIGSKEYQIFKEGRLDNVKADIAPMISQGRTMLPARMIAELLNIKIEFNNMEKVAKFVYLKDGQQNIVELKLGEKVMKVNGQEKELSANIIQVNGRIMLPLSDIQKALNELGLDIGIQWEPNTKQVILM